MKKTITLLALWLLCGAWTNSKQYDDTYAPYWLYIPAAGCVVTTPSSNWDLPNSVDRPAPACFAGTGTPAVIKGVLDFDDGTGASIVTPSMQTTLPLNPNWTEGPTGVVLLLKYSTASITGNVRWCGAAFCVADGESDTSPSFPAATCVDDAAKGTTVQLNDATITLSGASISTCAAGELLHIRIYRDSDHANDTTTGDARLTGVRVEYRAIE